MSNVHCTDKGWGKGGVRNLNIPLSECRMCCKMLQDFPNFPQFTTEHLGNQYLWPNVFSGLHSPPHTRFSCCVCVHLLIKLLTFLFFLKLLFICFKAKTTTTSEHFETTTCILYRTRDKLLNNTDYLYHSSTILPC